MVLVLANDYLHLLRNTPTQSNAEHTPAPATSRSALLYYFQRANSRLKPALIFTRLYTPSPLGDGVYLFYPVFQVETHHRHRSHHDLVLWPLRRAGKGCGRVR